MNKNFISIYTHRLDEYKSLIEKHPEDSVKYTDERDVYIMKCFPYLEQTRNKYEHTRDDIPHDIFKTTTDQTKITEREIYNDYMENVEGKKVNKKVTLIIDQKWKPHCPNCNSTDTYIDKDSHTCEGCGFTEFFIGNNLTYDEEQNSNTVQYFPYSRENHFRECLNQIQGQEITNIPDNVLSLLRYEFKKQRINDLTKITHVKVRELLKKLKMSKYYEHIPHITYHISGTRQDSMPLELEDKLILMFRSIQKPFEKFCPNDRKNFLSYPYILYKFCELLGHDEYLHLFSLLKSKEKLREHDNIWKNICNELQWEFIETV